MWCGNAIIRHIIKDVILFVVVLMCFNVPPLTCLSNRLPTRDNLRSRGIITAVDARCPLCNDEGETATHLFLHCRFVAGIWYAILRWLGVFSVLPPTLSMSYA
jgi:hypothetical protein